MAWLLCDDLCIRSPKPSTVFVFVHPRWTYDQHPRWELFDHAGLITDRFFPGTTMPCSYLEQGSLLRIMTSYEEGEDRGESRRPVPADKDAAMSGHNERPHKRSRGAEGPPAHYSLDANQSSSAERSMTRVNFLSSP
jgi:hypothetical protein